jgi:hypothetical protein
VIHRPRQSCVVESHLAVLDSAQWSELERIVERFEGAWHAGLGPAIDDYVSLNDALRAAVLCELVATDLQWRWRSGLAAMSED